MFLSHFVIYLLNQKAVASYCSTFPFNSGPCNKQTLQNSERKKNSALTVNFILVPLRTAKKQCHETLDAGRRYYLMLRKHVFKYRRQTCSTAYQLQVDRPSQYSEEPTLIPRAAQSQLPLKDMTIPARWLAAGLLCTSNDARYWLLFSLLSRTFL